MSTLPTSSIDIAAGVTFTGALCYFFIVKTRID